jgi:hypothetical protein
VLCPALKVMIIPVEIMVTSELYLQRLKIDKFDEIIEK